MSLKENKEEKVDATDDRVEIKHPDSPVEIRGEAPAQTQKTVSEQPEMGEEAVAEAAQAEETEVVAEEETDASRAERLQRELGEMNDKYLRLVAEFENFKRRNTQEMQTRFKFANQSLVTSLLSGIDTLERAIEQSRDETNDSLKEFVTGIEMAMQQFNDAFSNNHVERIVPKGELFDPNKHEAMGVINTDDVEPDHIAEVFQAGYLLHDRVIRPAMVQVAKKK
ncbi:MAG: nucleotide exchange factor GrpE [bacterium]